MHLARAAALSAAVVAARAGAECPSDTGVRRRFGGGLLEHCEYGIAGGMFHDARWLLSTESAEGRSMTEALGSAASYLRPVACSRENWLLLEQCTERCAFALELSSPPQLEGLRACLEDNDFRPRLPGQHINRDHPLHGLGMELVVTGSPYGCTAADYAGANYSGRIVLVREGGCKFHVQATSAAAAGAAATVVVSASVQNGISVQLRLMRGDSAPEIAEHPVVYTPRHYGEVLFAAFESGAAVRGRFVQDCSELSPAPEDPPAWDGCPDLGLTGVCGREPAARDRLCSYCPTLLDVSTGPTAGPSLCLYGNAMLPRAADTVLKVGTELPVRLGANLPGFARDPECRDDPDWADAAYGYPCSVLAGWIAQGDLSSCASLANTNFPKESIEGFLQHCLMTCPRSTGGVGCGGGSEGCAASDFDSAAGALVALEAPLACLPLQVVRNAQSGGAAGVIFLGQGDGPFRPEGPSVGVRIAVHSLSPSDSAALAAALQGAADRNVAATATVREGPAAPGPEPTPAPTTPEVEPGAPLLEPTADFEWSTAVLVYGSFCVVLVIATTVLAVWSRSTAVRPPERDEAASKAHCALSAIVCICTLVLIAIVAAVTFAVTYSAGRDTTDEALSGGSEAVDATHRNAESNMERASHEHVALFMTQIAGVAQNVINSGKLTAQKHAELFAHLDGSWERFEAAAQVQSELTAAELQHSRLAWAWRGAVRTVEGYFSSRALRTDSRPDEERGDGLPHVSVTRNGSLYRIGLYQVSEEGREFWNAFPRTAWDPLTNPARTPGLDPVRWVRSLGLKSWDCAWHMPHYTAPTPFRVVVEFTRLPFSCFCPIYNDAGDYVGVSQSVYDLRQLASEVAERGQARELRNATVVLFTTPIGEVVVSNLLRDYSDIEAYSGDVGGTDRITVPLTLDAMPFVHIPAAAAALRARLGGSFAGLTEPLSMEFDQADWYTPQDFLQFDFHFSGQRPSDRSGNMWRAGLTAGAATDAEQQELLVGGGGLLHIYRNLTADHPRVAADRSRNGGLYPSTHTDGGVEYVIFPHWRYFNSDVSWRLLLREPLCTAQSSFTLSMWVRPSAPSSQARLFDNAAREPTVMLDASGVLEVYSAWPPAVSCRTQPIPGGLPVGQWTHVTAVLAREQYASTLWLQGADAEALRWAQACRVYINGTLLSEVQLGESTRRFEHVFSTSDPYAVGRGFEGAVKGLKLWNVSASAEEVAQITDTGSFRRRAERRRWFLGAQPLLSTTERGLDWSGMVLIPRDDMMLEIDRNNEIQQLNERVRRDNNDRKLRQHMVEVTLLVVALVLACIILAIGFAWLLARPLVKVSSQMVLVSRMDLDEINTAETSRLLEVDSLLWSMRKVVANLKQFKSFLPASLFDNDSSADAQEEGEGQTLLPQLQAAETRDAVRCALSQAQRADPERAEALLAERFAACLEAGDAESARLLLACGWDAPPELRAQLPREPPLIDSPTSYAGTPVQGWMSKASSACSSRGGQSVGGTAQPRVSRYGDGADAPSRAVTTVPIFPPKYAPPPIGETVLAMKGWHSLQGETYWTSDDIADMMLDYRVCHGEDAEQEKISLYVYTIEMNERVTWTVWLGQEWVPFPDQDHRASQVDFRHVAIEDTDLRSVGLDAKCGCGSAALLFYAACGLRVYALDGRPFLIRYQNVQGGDPELSPLMDTVVWAASPDELAAASGPFTLADGDYLPPPPGVYEYITSRDFSTSIQKQRWSSAPVAMRTLSKLAATCLAQKNQQKYSLKLAQQARLCFRPAAALLRHFGPDADGMAIAMPQLYAAKCPHVEGRMPTPAKIAAAAEMGILRWGKEWMVTAFTGGPRCIAPVAAGPAQGPREHTVPITPGTPEHVPPSGLAGTDDAFQSRSAVSSPAHFDHDGVSYLWRYNRDQEGQPYYLMNYSIRMQQQGQRDATLHIPAIPDETFTARQPDEAPAAAAPPDFLPPAGSRYSVARWADGVWRVIDLIGASRLHTDAQAAAMAWALPQHRPLIWHLDAVLRSMPIEDQPGGQLRKGYRGLGGVQLDAAVYARGNTVVFGAFTSTSGDQGVASGFAMSEAGAAIFTMYGRSGRLISPWSRYGREKEVLYPPNTIHLVTEALSAEHAAILDKSKLQVFDLTEVTMAEAMHNLAKKGALEICREHPDVLRQADDAHGRAAEADWVGAVRELLSEPKASDPGHERRFQLAVRPSAAVGVVALAFETPLGREVGPGVDSARWSRVFQAAEQIAKDRGANLLSTHFGTMLLQVAGVSMESAARAAVTIATMVLQVGLAEGRASTAPESELTNPDSSIRSHRRGSGERSLWLGCGVSAGEVHSGFAGSSLRRVEIADGPAVRRALTLAGYARDHCIAEAVADSSCQGAIGTLGVSACIVDLVQFKSRSDIREPIYVTGGHAERAPLFPEDGARLLQVAWQAVLEAAARPDEHTEEGLKDCLAAVPPAMGAHRSFHALQEAATHPETYQYQVGFTFL